MIVCMLVVIIFQVRSLPALAMTVLTAPLGLVGVVPTLLVFHQPFGFNAILGLIALAGILMGNTLIMLVQITSNHYGSRETFHHAFYPTFQQPKPVFPTPPPPVPTFHPT